MKKFFVIAAMLLAGFTASAQINIGAGYLWDFWSAKHDGSKAAGGYTLNGVYAGASYNIKLVEGLGLAPGAYFSWATGFTTNAEGKKSNPAVKADHMALTIPVHVTYTAELGPGGFFAYLGPAFQYGLSLKNYGTTVSGDGIEISLDGDKDKAYNMFKKNDDGNRLNVPFDVKLGVGFGYNWKFLQANVGFDFGFLDRDANKEDKYKQHANAVHAGIAFVF